MSQNNGGLNWDQVQAPNFSGISQAQIAAAKMLDDAIGQGNKLNLAIGQGRSDEQEKNLLLNLSQYGKGEDALAAMNSGSLLDGINVKALSAEALRNLQKDIGGLYDLENKGIQNTQGYLNHDLTKANTGNVKANTASTYQSMRQSADTHRNTQNQREYENWHARTTNGMNSQQIEEFNRSEENTNAIQHFGVGFNTINSANEMLNNRVYTQDNLHTGTKQEAEVEGYNRAREINEAYNSIFAGASTKGEITKLVNDDIAQEKDPQVKQDKRRIANEMGVDTSYSDVIDNSAAFSSVIPTTKSNLFDDTLGAMAPQQQQPEANIQDSVMYKGQGQTSNLFDTSMDQVGSANAAPKSNVVNYAEEVKSNNVTISSDPTEVLTPTYTSKIDAVRDKIAGVKDHKDSLEFSIDDINAAAKSAIPDLTFSQYQGNIITNPMSGVSQNMNANQTPPISSVDMYRLSKELGKEVMDLPMSAENVAYLNNELKKLDSSPNSNAGKKREEANKRKRKEADKQIEEGARKYIDHYAKEAQSLGLSNQEIAQYAYNNARLRAANELLETQNAGKLKGAEGVEKTIAKIGNWYENISRNPTQFTQHLTNEVDHNLAPAIAKAMGPAYYSKTILEDVSNERTSVAEALIKNNSSADLKYEDVESNLKNIMYLDGVKVDAKTAGYLLAANGMKYDPEQIKEIHDASTNVTNSATITELNLDKANIDELVRVSGELAVVKSQITNSNRSAEVKERELNIVNERLLRALEELHFRQESFNDKYNNLKGE